MDVTSYLLGKNASGGGGGGDNEYFISTLSKDSSNANRGMAQILKKVPSFTLDSNVTDCSSFYINCFNLEEIPFLDTSNVTSMASMHGSCSITTLPPYDTSKVTNISNFAYSCTKLENVPVYDWSSVTNMTACFRYCPELTDQSLDNLLQSAITATSFTGTKTLKTIIGSDFASKYPVSRIQALPHYQDFIDAGWAIGYNA